ncbi:MAG: hypothetical protein FJ006_12985 [Chloroflexi bacterium]|nr:hypothetical protein [Chloroflexota bacterium]
MAVHSKYLYQLRQSIAYSLDDCVTGTAEANSTNSTLICSYLIRGNGFYDGWDLHIYAGTNQGQTREVTDSRESGTTLLVAPVFSNALTNNSQFELHKMFTTAQYNDAINRAIEMGKDDYLLDLREESATLTSDTYEYNCVSNFRYISALWLEDATDANTYYSTGYIDPRHYGIARGATPLLKFDEVGYPIGANLTGKKLRIVGQSVQSALSNNTDTCKMPPEFIIQQSRAILLFNKGKDAEAQRAQQRADVERKLMKVPLYAHSKAVNEV